jgi:DNA invertase Pin-like site-specific DNA recombinase
MSHTRRVQKVFSEQLSSVAAKRPVLDQALAFLREGDLLVIAAAASILASMLRLPRP